LWFSVPSQALQVLPLFVAVHTIELARMMGGGAFSGFLLFLAPVIEALLWPVVSVVLCAAAAGTRPGRQQTLV
jgi:rod shape-determining protein MreD